MDKQNYFQALNEFELLDSRLKDLRAYALEHNIPIIEDESLGFLQYLINVRQPKKILEIGTAIGYSAISMARCEDTIHITTIERDEAMIQEAKRNIQTFQLEHRIRLVEDDAITLDLSILDNDFDLIFIDAAKSQYQHFFEKYTPLLKKRGIVVTDNILFHDLIFKNDLKNRHTRSLMKKLRQFNAWLKDHPDFYTYFFQIGDGIALSIKK